MKKLLSIAVPAILIMSCTGKDSMSLLRKSTKEYVLSNVQNPDSYQSLFFSKIDTIIQSSHGYKYSLLHVYQIKNLKNENTKVAIRFYFDSTSKVLETDTKNFNGGYGKIHGNAYWYYVSSDYQFSGNKVDDGARISLYALDTLREGLKYEATADINGNFELSDIRAGRYLFVAISQNTLETYDDVLNTLLIYNPFLKQLFNYNLRKENSELVSNFKLHSYEDKSNTIPIAANIINNLPFKVCEAFGISQYSNSTKHINLEEIVIEEGQDKNIVVKN